MLNFRVLKHINYFLLFLVLLIISVGIFFIYSASYQITIETNAQVNYFSKQIVWALCGITASVFVILYDYEKLKKLSYPLLVVNVLLLLLVLLLGSERYGAQRWLKIGGFVLQPSEFTKITLILALARFLSLNLHKCQSLSFLIKSMLLISIPILLILKQPDLGTTLVFIPIFIAMVFVAGASLKYLITLLFTGLISIPGFWFFLKEYQKNRIRVFWDPNLDPTGLGYQSIQSKIAVGSGGLLGKGWLNGTQNQLNFLPKRHTDFIFSVIGEEWGFLGAVFVLMLYFALIVMGIYIASKSKDVYGKLVATGISVMILSHVMINVGMTIGVMPITGLPLLFLSYGGSSMLMSIMSIGLLQTIWIKRRYDY